MTWKRNSVTHESNDSDSGGDNPHHQHHAEWQTRTTLSTKFSEGVGWGGRRPQNLYSREDAQIFLLRSTLSVKTVYRSCAFESQGMLSIYWWNLNYDLHLNINICLLNVSAVIMIITSMIFTRLSIWSAQNKTRHTHIAKLKKELIG